MSAKHLEIGMTAAGEPFTLPAELGDKKFALLAQSKKGKTYGLGDVLEELTDAQRPWSAFDPGSNLWGLRVLPDGTPSGLPIIVMGGDHGDLELEKDAGERVAEAFLGEPSCLVIDVAFESKNVTRKFVTDYCNRLMRSRSAIDRVVFFEEAPEFVPQSANYSGIQVCKAAVDRLVRIGGNFGYGTWLISQRSATIDKDVLSQCEALIVMGLTDTRDRKAVKDWIAAKNIGERVEQCFDELGSLKAGEAWLWWPGEDRFERFQFRKRRTLHPREMKRLGLKPAGLQLGDARAFVERLKRQLTKTQAVVPAGAKKRALHALDPVTAMEISAHVGAALEGAQDVVKEHRDQVAELALENGKLRAQVAKLDAEVQQLSKDRFHEQQHRQLVERRLEAVRAHLRPQYDVFAKLFEDLGEASARPSGEDLGEAWGPWVAKAGSVGCTKMLKILIERRRLKQVQLATLAGVQYGGSTWRKYRGWLTKNHLARLDGDDIEVMSA